MKYIAKFEKEVTEMEDIENNYLVFPNRFNGGGGIIKPEHPEEGVSYINAAEIYVEGEWTYVADSFTELAEKIRGSL